MSTLDQADNPRRLVSRYDDSNVSSIAYPYSTMLGGIPGWVPSYRLSSPLHGLMVSRYRGGSASPLHLGGRNFTYTESKLSKILRSKSPILGPKAISGERVAASLYVNMQTRGKMSVGSRVAC